MGARKKLVYCYDYHTNKKLVYCYDYNTNKLVTIFAGQRIMARELKISHGSIQLKLDKGKPFKCEYESAEHTWHLTSTPL